MGIKFSSNEHFFDTWSPAMAYTLGYIVADGNLLHSPNIRAYYVKITSTDTERLTYFKQLLNSGHTIHKQVSAGKQVYVLRIGSRKLYRSLELHGLTPRKSLTATLPDVPTQYRSHFLRGYFDGDGCVFVERAAGARGTRIDKALRIIFTSGSKRFLNELNTMIKAELGICKNILVVRRAFQIRYSTADSVRLFTFMYTCVSRGAYMSRKFTLFKNYFEQRKDRVSKDVQNVLDYMDGLMVKR